MRLLFASIHSYLDPSSGTALATRELLELLTARGMDCRALCTGVLDYERETTLDEVLASLELPVFTTPGRYPAHSRLLADLQQARTPPIPPCLGISAYLRSAAATPASLPITTGQE